MIYVASPYSHPEPLVVAERVSKVTDYTVNLLLKGVIAFSPIVYCHRIALSYKMPTDAAFWQKFNFNIIRRSDYVDLLCLEGWEKSIGVSDEIDFCRRAHIKVNYVRS